MQRSLAVIALVLSLTGCDGMFGPEETTTGAPSGTVPISVTEA